MSDVLIRDLPEHVVAALDERAAALGISRVEFIRRRLTQEALPDRPAVTAEDLRRLTSAFPDLADADVMDQAWS